ESEVIWTGQSLESALEHYQERAMFSMMRRQITATEHGSERQRNEARDQNGNDDRYGEFVQETSDHATQKQHRNEHRNEGKRHRYDGETDFSRSEYRSLVPAPPHFHIANDVLEHDDGIIDHESHRQGQRHERERVQAIAEQISCS